MLSQFEQFLANAMHIHDPYANGHGSVTMQLALEIAIELTDEEIDVGQLRLAGFIHDVGKLFVPEKIINKGTLLTASEMDALRDHTRLGHISIQSLGLPASVLRTVLSHHENWDGSGYPDGLIGDSIDLFPRIIRVADSVSAMMEKRPYRPAKSRKESIEEIKAGTGKQYDPEIVTAFLRAMEKDHDG